MDSHIVVDRFGAQRFPGIVEEQSSGGIDRYSLY